MDSVLVTLARKAMGSKGTYIHSSGQGRSVDEITVRRWIGLHTTESILCVRRLTWWRDIQGHPEDNEQLRAALLGKLRIEEEMNITVGTVPWIKQLKEDIQRAIALAGTNEDNRMECARYGDDHILQGRWITYITQKTLETDETLTRPRRNNRGGAEGGRKEHTETRLDGRKGTTMHV